MYLFHGSPANFEKFATPIETGVFRKGEENREFFADVVFLTEDRDMALTYAGPSGVLYCVEATQAMNYAVAVAGDSKKMKKVSAKKLANLRQDVFVAKPQDIKIVVKFQLSKAGRNAPLRLAEII